MCNAAPLQAQAHMFACVHACAQAQVTPPLLHAHNTHKYTHARGVYTCTHTCTPTPTHSQTTTKFIHTHTHARILLSLTQDAPGVTLRRSPQERGRQAKRGALGRRGGRQRALGIPRGSHLPCGRRRWERGTHVLTPFSAELQKMYYSSVYACVFMCLCVFRRARVHACVLSWPALVQGAGCQACCKSLHKDAGLGVFVC